VINNFSFSTQRKGKERKKGKAKGLPPVPYASNT